MRDTPSQDAGPALPQRRSLPAWALPAGLLLLTALAFGQVLTFDFADWDDGTNVFQNPFYHPPTAASLLYFWKSAYYGLYMPVTYTAWWLGALLRLPTEPVVGQANPGAGLCHALNLAFHLGNVALVWALLRLLLRRSGLAERAPAAAGAAAAAGALLFAVHPLQVESVSWVTGLNNVLSAAFGFAALLVYLAGRTPGARLAARPAVAFAAATVLYVLALLSKPTAAALPLMALALDWGTGRPSSAAAAAAGGGRRGAKTGLAVLAVWAAIAVADALLTRRTAGSTADVYLPLWGRPFVAGDALAFYLYKLVLPFALCVDYGRTPATVLGSWWGYADTLATLAVAAALWRSRNRPLQTAALVALAALLPVLGFVPYYLHRWSTVGDRYAYLAMLGPAFGVAALWCAAGAALPPRLQRLLAFLYGAVAALWVTLSALQCATWRNDESIFAHNLAVNPGSVLAKFNLGAALQRQADPDGALALYEKCVQQEPDFAPSQYQLGSVLVKRGQAAEGIPYLREAVRLAPGYADAHNNLGLALIRLGKWTEAADEFRAALQADPENAAARANLAAAEAQIAKDPRAVLDMPPDSDPAAAPANAEGIRLARQGDTAAAALAFRRAIRARPDYAAAFYNLGLTLDRAGDLDGAAAAYRSALLRQPAYPEACLSLGVALARQGDATGAAEQIRAALRLRPGWPAARQALAALEGAKPTP